VRGGADGRIPGVIWRSVRAFMVAVSGVALIVGFVGAQASRGNVPPRAVDADAIARLARVNVGPAGVEANRATTAAVLAASGRYVAFVSGASDLVRGDTNDTRDVFVRDLRSSWTSRVSLSSAGSESNGPSAKPSISADGTIVAFPSSATNLVTDDDNDFQDVFVRDRARGTTERVSAGPLGEANGASLASLVSADGRVVAFSSSASNLVPGDRNGALDVFVVDRSDHTTTRIGARAVDASADRSEASSVDAHGRVVGFRSYAPSLVPNDSNGLADVFAYDRRADAIQRVNVSTVGDQADAATFRGMVSGNGRFVGFRSRANNLVPGDTNDALDVFVHDRLLGLTTRVSVSSAGAEASAAGFRRSDRGSMFMSRPFLSANGRYAAFTSRAANLVQGDTNGTSDVFVHDLWTGRTIRVSLTVNGTEANGDSFVSGISADGRVVAFTSLADNLVPGDTNHRRDVFVAWLRPAPIAAP
jgi:Tol biopolymer transport system component